MQRKMDGTKRKSRKMEGCGLGQATIGEREVTSEMSLGGKEEVGKER